MAAANLHRDFDEISAVYDETRHPLDPETIEGLLGFLREHGWTRILEVGVGTGRIAQPLAEAGLFVVGADASRGMLSHAAAKGVTRLVRATAFRLPFPDRAFDVALFVHVLHMLEDPGAALREAGRVSRGGVLALMDRSPADARPDAPLEPSPRDLVRQVLGDLGYPDILRAGPRAKEREILRAYPPKETRTVSDREVTEPLSRQLEPIEKRAYRHVLKAPREDLERAVALAREKIGSRTITYRRSEAVVWWPDFPAIEPSDPSD
jgi:ubiquinone/menaquinone biosynthesis C-methylase UbiE